MSFLAEARFAFCDIYSDTPPSQVSRFDSRVWGLWGCGVDKDHIVGFIGVIGVLYRGIGVSNCSKISPILVYPNEYPNGTSFLNRCS